MEVMISHSGRRFSANLQRPLDISLPLREGLYGVNCFFAPPMEATPVIAGDFIGSTKQGGPVNFFTVRLTPHGNGTHTESVGHIASEMLTINQSLKSFHFLARLMSIFPEKLVSGDRVITEDQVTDLLAEDPKVEALILRTMPNDHLKMQTNYSGANPPYLEAAAVRAMVEAGIRHLLVDLPSVDREEDGGQLLSHRAFWQYPERTRTDCTITELIYVDNTIRDGVYLLNLQIASFELDVSPSKPVLYELQPV